MDWSSAPGLPTSPQCIALCSALSGVTISSPELLQKSVCEVAFGCCHLAGMVYVHPPRAPALTPAAWQSLLVTHSGQSASPAGDRGYRRKIK